MSAVDVIRVGGGDADSRLTATAAHSGEKSRMDEDIDHFGENPSTAIIQTPSASRTLPRLKSSSSRQSVTHYQKSPIHNFSSAFLAVHESRFSPNISKNSSAVFCRICHEGDNGGERLISPCRCSGSVGLVHRTCIEKWLTLVNIDTCELCKEKYSVSRHPRPFSRWLCEPVVGDDQRNLVGDGVCFLLLTPLAGISAYLCASGAAFYFEEKKSEAIGLICLSSLLVIIYLAWLVLTIRYHCQVWFKWRLNNQDIRLLNVSGQRFSSLPKRRQSDLPPAPVEENSEGDLISTEDDVTPEKLFVGIRLPSVSMSSPICDSLKSNDLPVDEAVCDHVGVRKEHSEKSLKMTEVLCTPALPLSPRIFSCNPVEHSQSEVVRSTDDSEIYAQISVPCSVDTNYAHFPLDHQLSIRDRAVSVPYLPDLKEHFIALKSKQENGNVKVKSRGTFSPDRRPRTVTFTVTEVNTPEVSKSPQTPNTMVKSLEEVPRAKPLPPPVPVRHHQ